MKKIFTWLMASVLLLQMFSPMINVEQVRAEDSGGSELTITPNWTIESVKHVTDPFNPITLPSGVDSGVDYEVTIKTTFDDEVYKYKGEDITVNTIMTIPEGVEVWYPVWEDKTNTYTEASCSKENSCEVIYGMKGHPLSAITGDMAGSVYVKVTDWSKNELKFSLKLVDAVNTSTGAYGEESFTIKRSSYEFDLTNSKTDLPRAEGTLTNTSVDGGGGDLNKPNDDSINALKTAIFGDSSDVYMSDHLVGLSLKASDPNGGVGYTSARLNKVVAKSNNEGTLQVFLYSQHDNKWYDLVTQGWGSLNNGFNLYADEDTTLQAYVFADKEGEYKLDFSVVNLRDSDNENNVIVSDSHTINVGYIPFERAWEDLELKIQGGSNFDTKEITRDRDGNVKITIEGKDIDRIEFDHNYDGVKNFDFKDILEKNLDSDSLNYLTGMLNAKDETLDSMKLIEGHLFPNKDEPFCKEGDTDYQLCKNLGIVLETIGITATYTGSNNNENQKWELTLPKVLIDQFEVENNKKTITFYHTITSKGKKYGSMYSVKPENTFKYLIKERTSGGGGSSSSTTNNENKEDKTKETENTENTETESTFTAEQLQEAIKDSPYDKEQNDAYLFALKNGITTMNTVEKARISDPLTRGEFAKMIATYAIKILEKEIDQTKLEECSFSDTDGIGDLGNFSKLACGMGLMGQNMGDTFQPNNKITRAEVVTVISRMYGWTQDNTSGNYFANHMKEMHERGYIKNTNPTMDEIRGYIFIMLQRIADGEK